MMLGDDPIIREPVGREQGYWAGAPGAFHDADDDTWYLTYRIRRPRGVEPDRGGEARIARSRDLRNWEDIWSVNKSAYRSASIERSALRKGRDKTWRYFTSFVDPADGRWCVAVLSASRPGGFDATQRRTLFTAEPLGLEGVKDPWLMEHHGKYYMFLSVAIATGSTSEQSHSTLDIYNTGECISATALAISEDLDNWKWHGIILRPENSGWDSYCRRINSVVAVKNRFVAFYDGSSSHKENYEERTGTALSGDLLNWTVQSPAQPAFTSPHATRSLRYVDAQPVGDQVALFYEYAREDQAHDLRLHLASQADFATIAG